MLQFDVTHALPFLPENWLSSRLDGLTEARNLLERGNGLGGAFTGWVDLPASYDPEELQRILQTARIIRGSRRFSLSLASAAPIWAPGPCWSY